MIRFLLEAPIIGLILAAEGLIVVAGGLLAIAERLQGLEAKR